MPLRLPPPKVMAPPPVPVLLPAKPARVSMVKPAMKRILPASLPSVSLASNTAPALVVMVLRLVKLEILPVASKEMAAADCVLVKLALTVILAAV